jgi:hypothetical protein
MSAPEAVGSEAWRWCDPQCLMVENANIITGKPDPEMAFAKNKYEIQNGNEKKIR